MPVPPTTDSSSSFSRFVLPRDLNFPTGSSLVALSKRIFLQQSLSLPIEFIATYGVSETTLAFLQGLGLHVVEDLAAINDTAAITILSALPEKDVLLELWRDVVVEVTSRNLRRSLDNVVTQSTGENAGASDSPLSALGSTISIGASLSKGSIFHDLGDCKPCAWFHHREGCHTGVDCDFCHSCPSGELRKRKKERVKILKLTDNRARDQSS